MNAIKRLLGFVWMLLGPAAIIFLVMSAIKNINSDHKADISNPVPWLIIIGIFTPIAIGLIIFGWYSLKGVYDEEK
ncbi:MAG: DUF6814 family protein [Ferruginibacter sp.]